MRLRTLLLGSAAVLFAGSMASAPASAAEPIAPLGVTPMATMVDYLQSCADGEGFQLSEWCFALSGEVGFTASFGWDIDYGGDDADSLENYDLISPFPGPAAHPTPGNLFSYEGPPFPLSDNYELCLTATRETDTGTEIEIRFPSLFDGCGSGWPRLRVTGPGGTRFTFEDDEFEIMRPTGFGAVTLTLEENDDDEEAVFVPWPTPTLALELAFGNFDIELEAGLAGYYNWGLGPMGAAPSFSAEIGFDAGNFEVTLFGLAAWQTFDDLTTTATYNIGTAMDATGEWGYEGDLTVEAEFGPVELEVGGHVAHVSVFPDAGGRTFGGPPWYPMRALAWGVHAIAEVGFGMTTVSAGVLYGVNDDFGAPGDLRGNPYTFFDGDRVLLAFGGLGFEWNDFHETEFLTTYTSVLGVPGWSTLEVGVEHTFLPYGDDVIELTGELWWKTDLDGPLVGGAFGGEVGITVPIF